MARQYKTGLIITGDASGGIRAIKATEDQLGKLNRGFDRGTQRSRQFQRSVNNAGREMQAFRRSVLAGTTVFAAAASGMYLFTKSSMDAVDAQAKLARKLDTTIGGLRGIELAASDSGVAQGRLESALQSYNKRLGDTINGTGEAQKAYEQLGLEASELAKIPLPDQLAKIAERISMLDTAAERSSIADRLMSGGRDVVALFESGGDAIRSAIKEVDDYGLAISQVDAAGVEAANDAISRTTLVTEAARNAIATELAPVLLVLAEDFNTAAREAGGWGDVVVQSMSRGVQAISPVLDGLHFLSNEFNEVELLSRKAGAVIRQSMLELAATIAEGPVEAVNGLANQLARIPGIDIEALAQPEWTRNLRASAQAAAVDVSNLSAQLMSLRDGAKPSEKLEAFFERVNERSDQLRASVKTTGESFKTLDQWMFELGGGAAETSEEFDKLKLSLDTAYKAQQDYAATVKTLDDELRRGSITQAEYTRLKALAQEQLDAATGATKRAAASTKAAAKADKEAAKAAEERARALESLRGELDPAYAAGQKLAESTELLDAGLANGSVTLTEYLDLWDKAADVYSEATTGTDNQAKAIKSLAQEYDRHHQRAAQLQKDLEAINKAYKSGEIDGQQYQRMVGNVREEMRQTSLEADPMAQELASAWEEAGKRVDETFADAFTGAFDSFEDFGDQLLDGFKRLLGELAYQATLKPIVVSVTGQMQGMFGGGQQAMLGQQGGGLSLDSISPDMLSKGWDTVSGWFGGGGANAAAQSYAGSGWASSATSGGGWYGSATSGSANAGAAAGGWQSGLINAGYGLAGSYVGTEIGEAAFGKTANSNYGATLGTAIGTAILPGIGTGIGAALGSVVDTLFGSNEKTFDFDFAQGGNYGVFGDRESALGQFGITDFSDYKRGEQQDALDDMLNAIVEFDDTLARVALPERFEQLKESVEGFEYGDPEGLAGARTRAIVEGSGALGESGLLNIDDDQRLAEMFVQSLALESAMQGLGDQVSSDIRDEIARYEGEGDDQLSGALHAMDRAVQSFALLSAGADRLNLTFDESAAGAIHAASSMQDIVGGVQNLASMQSAYYDNYFTQTEKSVHAFSDVYGALSEVTDKVPETKRELRELVEAQDLNTEAGRETYARLLELAPAWSQVSGSLEDVFTTIYQDVLGREPDDGGLTYWIEQVESGSISLSDAMSQIQDSAEAAGNASDGAAISIADMAEAIRARESLERELLQAQGNTDALRERELDKLRELEGAEEQGLIALQERIWALEDAEEAEKQAAKQEQAEKQRAEQQAQRGAQRASQIAQEREQLERQLLQLQGDAAEIRRRELAELASSNQALQERIWALEDERKQLESLAGLESGFLKIGETFEDVMEASVGRFVDRVKDDLEEVGGADGILATGAGDMLRDLSSSRKLLAEALGAQKSLGNISGRRARLEDRLESSTAERRSQIALRSSAADSLDFFLDSRGFADARSADSILSATSGISREKAEMMADIANLLGDADLRKYREEAEQSAYTFSYLLTQRLGESFDTVLSYAARNVENLEQQLENIDSGQVASSLRARIQDALDEAGVDSIGELQGNERELVASIREIEESYGGLVTLLDDSGNIVEDLANAIDASQSKIEEIAQKYRDDLTGSFADAMGIDADQVGAAFDSVLSKYQQAAYTQEEIAQIQVDQAREAFEQFTDLEGLDSDTTISEFRDQFDDLRDTLSGAELGEWLAASGAIADLHNALEALENAAGDTSDEAGDAADSIDDMAEAIRARKSLEQQILQAMGDTDELRRREIESLKELSGWEEQGLVSLQEHIWALGDMQAAYQQLEQAVAEEKKIEQEAFEETSESIQGNIDDISEAMNRSSAAASSLRSALDGMIDQQVPLELRRAQGQQELLRILQSGGLGDQRDLDRALSAVGEPSEQLFGSFVDYQRDFWQTAAVVDQLHDRADEQLTTEERSLQALEEQLQDAENQHRQEMERLDSVLEEQQRLIEAEFGQLDWLDKINTGVASIPDAIAGLKGAISSATASRPSGSAGGGSTGLSPTEKLAQKIRENADRTFEVGGDTQYVYRKDGKNRHVSESNLDGSVSYERLKEAAEAMGVPGYADGGIATGPESGYPTLLHGTEAVIPLKGGSVPVSLSAPGGDNALLDELRMLNARVKQLEAQLYESNSISRGIADSTSKSAREAERVRREREAENA